jgi:type II secretory pathway pseudopilin PulG
MRKLYRVYRECFRVSPSSGQSFVEVVVATAILAISALGISGSLISLGKAKSRTDQITQAVTIESAIIAALSDQNNYSESVRTALRSGTIPNDLTLSLHLPIRPAGLAPLALQVGSPLFLDRQLNPCAPSDNPSCIHQVNFDVRNASIPGAITPIYRVAYSIQTQAPDALPLQLGATFPFQSTAAYTSEIPPSMYMTRQQNTCDDTEAFVTGVDRATGRVICAKRPVQACADNQVVTGFTVVRNVQGENQIQLVCENVQGALSCEPHFSLQGASASGLSLQGSCIYSGRETESWPTDIVGGSGNSPGLIEAEACPQNYEPINGCTFVQTANTPANCSYISGYAPNYGNWETGSWQNPANPAQICTQRRQVTHTAVMGTATHDLSQHVAVIQLSPTGGPRNHRCQLRVPVSECGATWQGYLRYTPTCRLQPPFRNPQPATQGGF